MKKTRKPLAIVVASALVAALGIGSTIAWLTDQTETVENTFTVGNIDITLDEGDDLDLQMVPGRTIEKDPVVSVEQGSEACYLFVKVDVENNTVGNPAKDYILWSIGEGWQQLKNGADDVPGVYYREVSASNAETGVEYKVLSVKDGYTDGYVTVNEDITKPDMDAVVEGKEPKLSFTAYAVQKENIADAFTAWQQI